MKFPSFLIGGRTEAKKECNAQVAVLKKASPVNLLESFALSENKEGLILMQPASPAINSSDFIHIYLLHYCIREALQKNKIDKTTEEKIFNESLTVPWAVLSLLATANVFWVYDKRRYAPFLKAVKENITLFDLPARFSNGSAYGSRLGALPNNLYYVLANTGLTAEFHKHDNQQQLIKWIDTALSLLHNAN